MVLTKELLEYAPKTICCAMRPAYNALARLQRSHLDVAFAAETCGSIIRAQNSEFMLYKASWTAQIDG